MRARARPATLQKSVRFSLRKVTGEFWGRPHLQIYAGVPRIQTRNATQILLDSALLLRHGLQVQKELAWRVYAAVAPLPRTTNVEDELSRSSGRFPPDPDAFEPASYHPPAVTIDDGAGPARPRTSPLCY